MTLLDVTRLTAWLDAQGLETDQPLTTEPLAGGRSNAMFVLTRGDAQWVLRRPARIAVDRANEGMRREYRFLAALADTDVPHPAAVALCDDHAVLGCTFFLMQRVEGVHPVPGSPLFAGETNPDHMAFALVDALAELHQVDWRASDLADLGRPDGFHERQVERWSAQLRSYRTRDLPGIERVMAWLREHVPTKYEPAVMHGDYHVMNTLIAPDLPARVVAILDWETATIGDPLLDLAGFCEIWSMVAGDDGASRASLVDRYRSRQGIAPIEDLAYYLVLYTFRLAVLLEGIYQRSLHDLTRDDQHDMGERALASVDRALVLMADAT